LKGGRLSRALEAALPWAVLAALLLSSCLSTAGTEKQPAAEEQTGQAVQSEPGPALAEEQAAIGPAQEQAGVSMNSPGSPAGEPEAAPGSLPEPGAEALGEIDVHSPEAPLPPEQPAGGPLPLPRAADAGPKSAASKPATPKTTAPAGAQGGAPPPAARPAAPAPPSTAAQAPAISAAERRREVLARKGDTVSIEQEGSGWLFLGLPPAGRKPGVLYLSSDTAGARSSFSFKALEYGEYDLGFQQQDNSRGLLQNETVRLRVLPDEQFREAVSRQAAAPEAAPLDPAKLEAAERLFTARAFDLALAEYLKLYRPADPLLNDRLGAIYAETGEPEASAKYFENNLSAPEPYGERAAVGLVRAGLAQGSEELIHEHLKELLAVRSLPIGRELLGAARLLLKRGRAGLALELALEYPRRYPRGAELDQAWFLLAQLYELESPLRDLARAREYYKKVGDEFPDSAFAVEARARVRYLDRYFFDVQ
jgi:hypothetical protein